MRKASTLVGLTLVAFSATAVAQEGVPPPAPAPVVVAPGPAPVGRSPRRLELGLSALVMGLGTVTSYNGIDTTTYDSSVSYGASLNISYRVVAGLSVGLAPQVIFGVNSKTMDYSLPTATEYNLMARIAYTFPIFEALGVYAEALPGYSMKSGSRWSRGFVGALGAGVIMGLGERSFANLGLGYQRGYQNLYLGAGAVHPERESYLRVAIGGGVRF